MLSAFSLRPIYSADNNNSRSDAAGKCDLFHVIPGDASARGNNRGRFLSDRLSKEFFPDSDRIKSRGSSDSVPERKFRQKNRRPCVIYALSARTISMRKPKDINLLTAF